MALSAEQPFVLRAHPLAWDDAAEMDRLVEMAERSGVVAWCFHRLLQQEGLAQELPLLAERMKKRYMAILIDNSREGPNHDSSSGGYIGPQCGGVVVGQ